MASVLLTHSYHLPYDPKQVRKMQPYTPIGTLYAATALRDHGITVAVFDTMLLEPEVAFADALRRHRPKIVVVYEDDFNFLSKMCLTRMRDVAWSIAAAARETGAIVIVHGSDSTDDPDLFLGRGFDYVLCGEAEQVLVTLCSSILGGTEAPPLDGVMTNSKQGHRGQGRERLARNSAWAQLARPARELIDLEPYRAAWQEAHGYFSTNMVSSRGCPFQCNWCAKPISGNRFHLRAAASVAEEMRSLKDVGVEHIWFGDDIFALNRHWVQVFAAQVVKQDARLPFKVQSRADLMHEDTVEHLKASGCAEVWMGVESGAQTILDAMDKNLRLETVVIARERLRAAGIRACFFLQLGYPGEGWEELQKTVAFVRKTRPDDVGISFSYPLPGTVFYNRVQAQLGAKRNWADSDDLCIMFQATYTTEFYRAVRDAIHAEVDSWKARSEGSHVVADVDALWRAVETSEAASRCEQPFVFTDSANAAGVVHILPLDQLAGSREA
ncbi:B12-binding domain-containing radical SAM protein [Acidipila sp. EB88]|uniref:B12-binding domain-containing radical SAM protein n=1 Tax=Acidipila sp. EB88 TaxID=2305226 RepID=UPI000F5DADCA|nr:radical SAM protein [Acidipila sp. EB88]RRA49634.1 radical SAM protein [Acidipila sp. EB88]